MDKDDFILDAITHLLGATKTTDTEASKTFGVMRPATQDEQALVVRRFDPSGLIKTHARPMCPWLLGELSSDRLFTPTADLLLTPPAEIIGRNFELAIADDQGLRWTAFRQVKSLPRGFAFPFGEKATHIYESHQRHIDMSMEETYLKCAFGWSAARGRVVPALIATGQIIGSRVAFRDFTTETFVLFASIAEDMTRPAAWRVEIHGDRSLKLAVEPHAVRELFALREGPTVAGRRRPLLHWVKKHTRRTQADRVSIPKHLRGITEFEMDGYGVRITAPVKEYA